MNWLSSAKERERERTYWALETNQPAGIHTNTQEKEKQTFLDYIVHNDHDNNDDSTLYTQNQLKNNVLLRL